MYILYIYIYIYMYIYNDDYPTVPAKKYRL